MPSLAKRRGYPPAGIVGRIVPAVTINTARKAYAARTPVASRSSLPALGSRACRGFARPRLQGRRV